MKINIATILPVIALVRAPWPPAIELDGPDPHIESWSPGDSITVFAGEYKIDSMALAKAVHFDVYHLGLVFRNERLHEWLSVEFFMADAEGVASMFAPTSVDEALWELPIWEQIGLYMTGSALKYFSWENQAVVSIKHWGRRKPKSYTELTLIGETHADELHAVLDWIHSEYTANGLSYDVWGLYQDNVRIRRSRICYDFVEDVIGRMRIRLAEPETIVFREGVVMNVVFLRDMDVENNPRHARDYLRYMRVLSQHSAQIAAHLVYTRMVVAKFALLGLPYIMGLERVVEVGFENFGAENYCRRRMVLKNLERDTSQVPRVDVFTDPDPVECLFPTQSLEEIQKFITFTWTDWMVLGEFWLDNFLVGRDGDDGIAAWWYSLVVGAVVAVGVVGRTKCR
jgi:hypothetical protein